LSTDHAVRILHRLLQTPAFKEGPLGFVTAEPSPLSIDTPRLHRLLLAHYRILQANRELPCHFIWPLTPLSLLIWTPHLDNGARLLAIRCYALQSGMGEAEREKMERQVLGEICGPDCLLDYGQNIDGSRKEVDGWIMPVIELERVRDMRNDMVTTQHDYFSIDEGDPCTPIDPSHLWCALPFRAVITY
jgi:midasin